MAEKDKAEKSAGKLVLFNHSRNPYNLGKNADGSVRWFRVGDSIECKDEKEYNTLRNYRGISTTAQVAPSLQTHISKLESEKAAHIEEIADLKKRLEKFESKGK